MKNIKLIALVFSLTLFSCQIETESVVETSISGKLKVAVFGGNGASVTCILETMEALKIDKGIQAEVIQSYQISAGELDNIDVLIFPGGSGSKEYNNLGADATQKVKEFAKEKGNGVVGICAGGYLLSTTEGYPSLELTSATVFDRPHYNRGRGLVEFELNSIGEEVFPELKDQSLFLQYYDGPVLVPIQSNTPYVELGTFKTDIHPDNKSPEGITPGRTFLLEENYGEGKVVVVAGHPESTPGMRWIVPRMARRAAGSELVSYNQKWIRPEINDEAIIFDAELNGLEKENFWKLFEENPENQIVAMDKLLSLRSRPGVRYNIGLLRSDSPEVRKHAANLLMQTEYSAALNDLKQALTIEKDPSVKLQLEETIEFLTNY